MQAHPLSSTAARNFTYASQFDPPTNAFTSAIPRNLKKDRDSLARPGDEDQADAPGGNAAASVTRLAGSPQALAHDARNLLLALGLYGDLLGQPGVLQPRHQHYASELQLLGKRSTRLMERLLEGHAAGPQPQQSASQVAAVQALPPRTADGRSQSFRGARASSSGAVLRSFAPLLAAVAGPQVRVSVAAGHGLPALPFARETLERILVNLVRNAAEAIASMQTAAPTDPALKDGTPGERPRDGIGDGVHTRDRGGHIRVALSAALREVRLTVKDDGPGLPAFQAAAFLHPAPLPAGARRGLGHRIVADLVAATGGRLSIRPANGGGTCITIRWAVASRPVAGTQARKAIGGRRRGSRSRLRPNLPQPNPLRTLASHPLHEVQEGAFASC